MMGALCGPNIYQVRRHFEENELPTQVRTFTYAQGFFGYHDGAKEMNKHIAEMVDAGWEPMSSASDPGHLQAGKTVGMMALTGGLSLLFGASRTDPTVTIIFRKRDETPEAPAVPPSVEGVPGIRWSKKR
jgi:hypothetical protein